MAAILWSDVVDIASGVSGVANGAQATILGLVNNELNIAALGLSETSYKLKLARQLLAAHLGDLALRKGGGGGVSGPVSSETYADNQIRIDYAAASSLNSDALQATPYGREFAALVRRSPARTPFAL